MPCHRTLHPDKTPGLHAVALIEFKQLRDSGSAPHKGGSDLVPSSPTWLHEGPNMTPKKSNVFVPLCKPKRSVRVCHTS